MRTCVVPPGLHPIPHSTQDLRSGLTYCAPPGLVTEVEGDVIFKIVVDGTGRIVLGEPVEGDSLMVAASVDALHRTHPRRKAFGLRSKQRSWIVGCCWKT